MLRFTQKIIFCSLSLGSKGLGMTNRKERNGTGTDWEKHRLPLPLPFRTLALHTNLDCTALLRAPPKRASLKLQIICETKCFALLGSLCAFRKLSLQQAVENQRMKTMKIHVTTFEQSRRAHLANHRFRKLQKNLHVVCLFIPQVLYPTETFFVVVLDISFIFA